VGEREGGAERRRKRERETERERQKERRCSPNSAELGGVLGLKLPKVKKRNKKEEAAPCIHLHTV
jgi:hypothetical protein